MRLSAKKVLLVLIIHFYAMASTGQENDDSGSSTAYVIPRINGPVTLDGMSDEPAWAGIEPLPTVMQVPSYGDEPTEKTEILIAFDDDYLYAAGRLYDSDPKEIRAPSRKRDYIGSDNDWFGIVLDTFNDKENALSFFTTPEGLRLDATVFNDAQGVFPVNTSWNTFWDVATERTDEGWFAEIRIPMSSLRFQEKDGRVVMGLLAWRLIARKFELHIYPGFEAKWGFWSAFKPSRAQEVVFEDLKYQKPLYVAPYTLGGVEQAFDLNESESAYVKDEDPTFEAGIDVKVGLTSNLTLDLTVNTDFAQVEADDQQVNLTRFSLFFPEKRLFFQERASNLEFKFDKANRLFYSRRIGIDDGEMVRIYGGARLVGRIGRWDVGLLNMQTAEVEDLPSENFGAYRMRRQIFNPYSYVGGMVTSRIGRDGRYNTAYGLDGIFRLYGNDYLSIKWAQTFETGAENDPVSLDPARAFINWERRSLKGLGYDLSYSRAGSAYNPGVGFEFREDYTRFGDRVIYGWMPGEDSPVFRHNAFVDGFVVLRNSDNTMESMEIGPGYELETKSSAEINLSPKAFYENVPDSFSLSDDVDVPEGEYRFYGFEGRFESTRTGAVYADATIYAGTFYDGWRVSHGLEPTWNVSSSLQLSGAYELNLIRFPEREQELFAKILRLRALVMLSTKLTISTFVQYNSVDDAVIANVRARYNPREGNDLYIVYNDGLNTDRYREIPALPRTSVRTLLVKYTYTFTF